MPSPSPTPSAVGASPGRGVPEYAQKIFDYVDRVKALPPSTSIERECRDDNVSTFSHPTALHRTVMDLPHPSAALYGHPSPYPAPRDLPPLEAFEAPSALRRVFERDHPRPSTSSASTSQLVAGSPGASLRRPGSRGATALAGDDLRTDKISVQAMAAFLDGIACHHRDCVTPNDYSVRIAQALRLQYDPDAPLSTVPKGVGARGVPARPTVMARLATAGTEDLSQMRRPGALPPDAAAAGPSDEVEELRRTVRSQAFEIDLLQRRLAMRVTTQEVRPVEAAAGRLRESVEGMRQEIGFIAGDVRDAFAEWARDFEAIPCVRAYREATAPRHSRLAGASTALLPQEAHDGGWRPSR